MKLSTTITRADPGHATPGKVRGAYDRLLRRLAFATITLLGSVSVALAHMQFIDAGNLIVERPGEVEVALSFGHPNGTGPMLDMVRPTELTLVHRVQRKDLMGALEEVPGPRGNTTYRLPIKIDTDFGDYIIALKGGRYFDIREGGYVEQYAKVLLNFGGPGTDWFDQIGLPVEIVPMVRPYAVVAGSTFTGRVATPLGPVRYAKVEFLRLSEEGGPKGLAGDTSWGGALTVISDGEGIFTVGIPTAGKWMIVAYGAGRQKRAEDNLPLTQDALLLIEAHDWFDVGSREGELHD